MTNTKQKDWEKEFDVQFPISIDYPPITSSEVLTNMEVDRRHKRAIYKHEQIKNFIQNLLTQQKKEIVEIIEKQNRYVGGANTSEYVSGFNQCKDIIINLLTKE